MKATTGTAGSGKSAGSGSAGAKRPDTAEAADGKEAEGRADTAGGTDGAGTSGTAGARGTDSTRETPDAVDMPPEKGGTDTIRTFPFPVELTVGGVGMHVGPMGPHRTWHAAPADHRVHRIDFHVVMLFDRGPVRHMVDFTEYEAYSGDVLWIRPGQVHRFSRSGGYRGTVLTMQPGFLPRPVVEATGLYRYDLPPLLHPDAAQLAGLGAALAQLRREYRDTETLPAAAHTAVLRHSLTAFLYRLAHLASSSQEHARECADTAFIQFREAVERDFATNHSVSAYADALGYSRRTLVRAVRAATGKTPKAYIDGRVMLEAKRLLAHTDLPIGRVGAAVGFPDAANFSKFFQLHEGRTPAAFRQDMR